MREGNFDVKCFFQELKIPKNEQNQVQESLVDGVERYYRHIYGYDKYGPRPSFMVAERMYEPYIFGFGAVEIVRNPSICVDTKVKVVGYTLEQTRPMEEYGTPQGLAVLLSLLATAGSLDMTTFRSVMQIAAFEGDMSEDCQPLEVCNIADWLITQAEAPEDELLWWLWYISCRCQAPHIGKPLAQHLLDHGVLSEDLKARLCHAWLDGKATGTPPVQWRALEAILGGDKEALKSLMPDVDLGKFSELLAQQITPNEPFVPSFGLLGRLLVGPLGGFLLTPAYLKRQALGALARLGEDPLVLCRNYLGSERGDSDANAVNQGVADLIREHRASLPAAAVRDLVDEGLRIGAMATRKTFYQLGADLFGQDYWARALNDNARTVREWAGKKVMRNIKGPPGGAHGRRRPGGP